MRSSISLPTRSATSSTSSFSSRPCGPCVPWSWPPWPASITMRPTLRPSARVSELPPVDVRLAPLLNSPGSGAGGADAAGTGRLGLAEPPAASAAELRRSSRRASASGVDFGFAAGRESAQLVRQRLGSRSECRRSPASFHQAAVPAPRRLDCRRSRSAGAPPGSAEAASAQDPPAAADWACVAGNRRPAAGAQFDDQAVGTGKLRRGDLHRTGKIQHHAGRAGIGLGHAHALHQLVVDLAGPDPAWRRCAAARSGCRSKPARDCAGGRCGS